MAGIWPTMTSKSMTSRHPFCATIFYLAISNRLRKSLVAQPLLAVHRS
jgi:hypothetical protein